MTSDRLLDPTRVTPTPWLNGGGVTRQLASDTAPDGTLRWRVSVADLEGGDAEFSTFPGLDRLFVPLGPLQLTIEGTIRSCKAGDQVRFAGEAHVTSAVPAATRALNVMTRRGLYHAEVALRPRDGNAPPDRSVVATVLLGTLAADVRLLPLAEGLP